MKRGILLAAALMTLVFVGVGCGAVRVKQGTNVGDLAPAFSLKKPDGQVVNLESLRGKPVFVNFWATWCPPCRAEMPDLQAMYEKYGGRMHFVAVNVRESASTVTGFMKINGYDLPVAIDASGSTGDAYRVTGIPTSFVLDGRGVIQGKQVGMLTAAQMEELIGKVLK